MSSRLPRAEALISITELLPRRFRLSFPQVFLSFFFPAACSAKRCDHKPMARRRIRASARKADGRGMCAFVQTLKPHLSGVRRRGADAPKMRSEQLEFLCTGWYGNSQQISIEFLGEKRKTKRNLPAREEKKWIYSPSEAFVPTVLSKKNKRRWCGFTPEYKAWSLKVSSGGLWMHLGYQRCQQDNFDFVIMMFLSLCPVD